MVLTCLSQQWVFIGVLQVVKKLTELDASGQLPGVIDDRGKFVYITKEEMDKIASFIKRRGRVNIDDIAKEWYVFSEQSV